MIGWPNESRKTWTSPLTGGAAVPATTRNGAVAGAAGTPDSVATALSVRGPSRSRGRTSTCAVNPPFASVKTGWSGVGVIPMDQVSTTGAFAGKPAPVAIVTVPAGPVVGSSRRIPMPTAATSGTVSGGPALEATERSAVRVPVAVPMNRIATTHEAPGARLLPVHGLALSRKSPTLAPLIAIAPGASCVVAILFIGT